MIEPLEIIPRDLKFAYQFTENECYKERTGKCSLDENFDINKIKKKTKQRSDKEYCQRLYSAMLKNTRFSEPSIHICKCGHYDFTDGRHWICICQKKDLKIMVEISQGGTYCLDCE